MTDDSKPDTTNKTEKTPKPSPPGGGKGKGAAPDAAPAARRFDGITIAVAAVLGAAIALGAQYALTVGGVWPGPAAPDLSSLESRVSALERADRSPAGPAGPTAAEVNELRQSLARLRDQVANLEQRPAQSGGPDVNALVRSIDELQSQLDAAEAQLADLDERTPADLRDQLAGLADDARVTDVEARVAQLEEDVAHSDERMAAMALGLAQLARAAQGSQPFVDELAAVEVILPGDPRLADLTAYAETGVPTTAALERDFPAVARAVTHAAQTPAEQTAWGRVWAWAGQYISFRRTGDTEGDSVHAILARAEEHMDEGDLRAGLREMESLPDTARGPAAGWIDGARARVAVDRLTTALTADVLSELER
jgi:hypothetical protein